MRPEAGSEVKGPSTVFEFRKMKFYKFIAMLE